MTRHDINCNCIDALTSTFDFTMKKLDEIEALKKELLRMRKHIEQKNNKINYLYSVMDKLNDENQYLRNKLQKK